MKGFVRRYWASLTGRRALTAGQLAGVACATCGRAFTDQDILACRIRVEGKHGLRQLYVCDPTCTTETARGGQR